MTRRRRWSRSQRLSMPPLRRCGDVSRAHVGGRPARDRPRLRSSVPAAGASRRRRLAQSALSVPATRQRVVAALFLGSAEPRSALMTGHLVFNLLFDADPGLAAGRLPRHPVLRDHAPRAGLTPRRELIISSAGFWVQHAGSEWLLTRRPRLRRERAPFAKGVLAFNVLASAALRRRRLREHRARGARHARHRHRRAASTSAGSGAMILAPAVLDALALLPARGEVGRLDLARSEGGDGPAAD